MKSRIATLVLTVASIVFVAQPAVADTATWDGKSVADCAPGTISGALTGYTATSSTDLAFAGTVTPCVVQGSSVYFGYIRYEQNGGNDAGPLLPYGTGLVTDASTTLHLETWVDATAICLAASPTERLSCVSVTMVSGLPTFAPISITDPRVEVPYMNGHGGGHGNCATCL